MELSGTLEQYELLSLLRALSVEQLCGLVELSAGNQSVSIALAEGQIVAVTSTEVRQSLPAFLLRGKLIDRDTLNTVMQGCQERELPFGVGVIEAGVMDAARLEKVIKRQAAGLLVQAFQLAPAHYSITRSRPPAFQFPDLELDMDVAFFQAVQRDSNPKRVGAALRPHQDELIVPMGLYDSRRDKLMEVFSGTAEGERVMAALGSGATTLKGLTQAGYDVNDVSRMVYAMVLSGMVSFQSERPNEVWAPVLDELIGISGAPVAVQSAKKKVEVELDAGLDEADPFAEVNLGLATEAAAGPSAKRSQAKDRPAPQTAPVQVVELGGSSEDFEADARQSGGRRAKGAAEPPKEETSPEPQKRGPDPFADLAALPRQPQARRQTPADSERAAKQAAPSRPARVMDEAERAGIEEGLIAANNRLRRQSLYQILGVPVDAPMSQIGRRCTELKRKYRPEKYEAYVTSPEGKRAHEEILERIDAAYDTLLHPESRVAYHMLKKLTGEPMRASLEDICSSYQHALRASQALRSGELSEAIGSYKQALTLVPYDATAHAQLSWTLYLALREGGQDPSSRDLFDEHMRRALELDPRNTYALVVRARVAQAEDDGQTAQELYQRVLKLDPHHKEALQKLKAK